LEDPEYEIQLHGGEFDVGCLKRDYNIALGGVWDSQQAASFLGWKKTGYGAVVEQVCGVSLPKAHTRHDWSRRPVTGPELQYAINDVRYLPAVVADLKIEVRVADLNEEVSIACAAVEKATWNGGFKPENLWTIKGVRQLAAREQMILMALYRWRETPARELNMPAGRTMNNELLIALARNSPTRADELKRLGVPKRVTGRWTTDLLGIIAEAQRTPPQLPPQPPRRPLDRQVQKRGDRLKKWRREEAERREVPMQVILPVAALKHLQEHGGEDLESVPQLGAKRIRRYGDTLVQLAANQI
jgi:ribonuclease D